MDTQQILDELYVEPAVAKPRRAARRLTWYILTISLFISAWVVSHLYYYNLLIELEFDVKAAWAQVEAQKQRRFQWR